MQEFTLEQIGMQVTALQNFFAFSQFFCFFR